ncbi:hypothetical protein CEXT_806411 [Caerostris extrusa]|uniref:Uncharacterized protein n=1 Tax=Caerostris extrusa TaxID=172846 RepID=A0AAV4UD35_CAEEX|nr:hypothetical protein CEXT_806411 [Caerostris extrusa]
MNGDIKPNQSIPRSCPLPLTSFDKTENISAPHTDQKTFRKPPLLFPIPTRVSVTHNRNLRPCYRFQLKTSLCDVHFKMSYKSVVGVVEEFSNRRVRFRGGSPQKRERWIGSLIASSGQGAKKKGWGGKGCFLPPPRQTTGTDFQLLYLFSDDSQARGYSKGLKKLSPLPSSKVILIAPDRISCSSTLGRG